MKLIVITPAGREKYLRLLAHHVLGSPVIAEWHLWDNCRNASDREYLRRLAASDPRCKLKQLPGAAPDREIKASRFSIDAIGFFGAEKLALGDLFMPPGAQNEEEWLSAVLPMRLDSCGKVLGDMVVAHFSFYPQERRMLQTDILERYYALVGLPAPAYDKPVDRKRLKERLRPWKKRPAPDLPKYRISLREGARA